MSSVKKHYVICGDYPPVIAALRERNIDYIVVKSSTILPRPVAAHADMLCYYAGNGNMLTYDEDIIEYLSAKGYSCTMPRQSLGARYPHDIALNCLRIHDLLLANTRACAREVIELAEKEGRKIIDVKQGYVRCSTAVISQRAAITADRKIADALEKNGVEVLRICAGGIEIDEYDYGFIGGCCVCVAPDTIMVAGALSTHADGDRIIDFIKGHGCEIITVQTNSENNLFDFGGVVVTTDF